MKLTRRALRQMILKEFRDTTFNGDMTLPPGGFSGFEDPHPQGGGGKNEAILKIYLGDYSDNVLKKIYGGNSEASVKRAIDRAIQEFERILAELELTQGITGMEPDDFPDTMGPTNPSDIERQQTLLNYTNGRHMEAYPPGNGALYGGTERLYPDNPEYYQPSSSHGPVTNLLLNIEDGNVWGSMAMWYIVENYPHMRIDGMR